MEKEISAKTDIVVNIKWLFLLLKSAEVTFLVPWHSPKMLCLALSILQLSQLLVAFCCRYKGTIHLPVAVMPTCNDSRNQPRTDWVFRYHQHVPLDASMGQRQRKAMPHSIMGEEQCVSTDLCWIYSSLCNSDHLLERGERNNGGPICSASI